MRLKALEIQGFKSFPDKTILTFDAGITAIVGPNGSGKSNISDAIRWVMGEQSTKALRGGKMEDVIFGGTQERKGLGFAQVSLLLDNEDGALPMDETEVVVTRRYYRSGDSEYYINRHLVRLRDINELFMDTGLGQEGYSIIGQGKIDEILSVKSTQRRQIFEEAAGISRFRHRKEESERKLERTRENLLRIQDKMEELELQLEPLEEQADKARRFFAAREGLRGLEVSLWLTRLEALREDHHKLRADQEAMLRQLEQVRGETDRLYAESERLSGLLQDKERDMESARSQLRVQEEAVSACESSISVLEVRLQGNEENTRRLREELSDQQGRDESLGQQISARHSRREELEEAVGRYRETLEELAQTMQRRQTVLQDCRLTLAQLEQQERSEGSSAQQTQSLLSALDASAREVGSRQVSIAAQLLALEETLEAAETEHAQREAACAACADALQEAETKLAAQEQTLTQATAAEKSAQESWTSLRMEENTLLARIRMLEEMEKVYEGYSRAVKVVMEQAGRGELKGVHGPVAELIKVPERFAVAMEIALGGAMQNLVVENEQAGKTVIGYLKSRDAGRVTCLPMDTMRPGSLQESGLDRMEGFLGVASELVDYDNRYERVFSNLLGRVVIARDLDCAVRMARQYKYRFRIVTLDGQLLSPGGAMTGGSTNKKGGIITRAKELERLVERRDGLQADRARAQQESEAATRRAQKENEVRGQLQQTQREAEAALLQTKAAVERCEIQEQEILRQQTGLMQEQESLRKRTQETQDKSRQAQQALSAQEQTAGGLSREREQLAQQISQLQEELDSLSQESNQEQIALATAESESRVSRQAAEELELLRRSQTEETRRRGEEMERLTAESRQRSVELQQQRRRKENLQEEKQGGQRTLEALSAQRMELEGKRNQAERDSRAQNETLLYCQRESAVLEQKALSCEQEETQLLDKLWESYELSHEAALAVRMPIEDEKAARRQVTTLKEEIRALGAVNLGAIEEFERVNERHGYLQEQRQDVEQAADNLVTIIDDLTKEMTVIFRREFARIREAFQETFLRLFQGGKASLELEDEQDVLNCGIEIQAQPPGKTLSNLNLLSGGEKAFVAIAIYFAILKVRPTPFCVLDEIEAALDEANVLRFARYLREICDKTQFILITHRRGSMEEADLLYGVTMERQGVSKLLRLELNEVEQALIEG